MQTATKLMIREWVALHRGDTEAVARWMRDALRFCGLRDARRLVAEAMEG